MLYGCALGIQANELAGAHFSCHQHTESKWLQRVTESWGQCVCSLRNKRLLRWGEPAWVLGREWVHVGNGLGRGETGGRAVWADAV